MSGGERRGEILISHERDGIETGPALKVTGPRPIGTTNLWEGRRAGSRELRVNDGWKCVNVLAREIIVVERKRSGRVPFATVDPLRALRSPLREEKMMN